MEYKNVIKEIERIMAEDFTMDSLRNVGLISQTIDSIYNRTLSNENMNAENNYILIKDKLNSVVFEKLKEKLGFEDEVINQILKYIDVFKYITDIYVLDGNVIIKLMLSSGKELSYLVSDGFYDVTSKEFVDTLDYNVYRGFFVSTMNCALIPTFKDVFEKSRLLNVQNGIIGYNLDNLNIYINKSLREIMQINTDVTGQVAKVLVKHNNDELYYYDLKIHYAYLELARNDYKVHKISEMLSEKGKVKTR